VHEHRAPHGGALIELGDEAAHLELVVAPASGRLTAYALDGEAEAPVRLVQPEIGLAVVIDGRSERIALAAVASDLTGERVGDTSQFSAQVASLAGRSKFEGVVVDVTVRGQTFRNVAFRFP
jgi:hypothetical protein